MTIAYKKGDKDVRPWGTWEILAVGNNYIIKEIVVMPDQMLSLQSHNHRSEHWIITKGVAEITLGDQISSFGENEHIFIPVNTKHRVANRTTEPIIFVELATGNILDETDIIRYEDIYKRV